MSFTGVVLEVALNVVQLGGGRKLSGKPYKEDPDTFRKNMWSCPWVGEHKAHSDTFHKWCKGFLAM